MPAPTTHASSRSSPSSAPAPPSLELEPAGSLRLALAWLAWCLALAGSSAWALWRAWAGLGAGSAAMLLPGVLLPLWLLRPGWRWLMGRGPRAVRRLCWLPDGRWWLEERGGAAGYVSFGAPRQLGGLFWLRGQGGGRVWHVFLDGTTMEPNALRLLKARVRFPAPTGATGLAQGPDDRHDDKHC